jgi:NAD(P)-dependent dehydrogenase (short-subunit alcohol dehydrogenase family)
MLVGMTGSQPLAIITGASQGLGRALAHELAGRGWALVLDARHERALHDAVRGLPGGPHPAIAGDVADPAHRRDLVDVAAELGGARALVNNASTLGASPLPSLAELDQATYLRILEVLNVTSDASVEPYETWGGYGSSKAGLDHATRVLAAEEPALKVYAVDPGDMRTQMHQDAFPGEDISDRPEPTVAVPALLRLLAGELPSGRYRASELLKELTSA